jgi:hypothetical protein
VIILRGSDDFLPSEGASWGTVTLFSINLANVSNFLWDDYWVSIHYIISWLNKVRLKGFFEETKPILITIMFLYLLFFVCSCTFLYCNMMTCNCSTLTIALSWGPHNTRPNKFCSFNFFFF